MKIYQIHERGGEWEDYYDYIVSSYLSEEKAIAEKERLEKEQAEKIKCNECPLYYCPQDCQLDCLSEHDKCRKRAIKEAKRRCEYYESSDDEKCANYYYDIYGDSSYSIEEVEVIE